MTFKLWAKFVIIFGFKRAWRKIASLFKRKRRMAKPHGLPKVDRIFDPSGIASPCEKSRKKPKEFSKPYIFCVENKSDKVQRAILYGCSKFLTLPNYGSDEGIVITPMNDVSYLEHILTSAFKPFSFQGWRVSSTNLSFLDNGNFCAVYTDINGRQYTDPIPVRSFKSILQVIDEMIDLDYPITINCNNYLYADVPANTQFVITIFPNVIWENCKKREYSTPGLKDGMRY